MSWNPKAFSGEFCLPEDCSGGRIICTREVPLLDSKRALFLSLTYCLSQGASGSLAGVHQPISRRHAASQKGLFTTLGQYSTMLIRCPKFELPHVSAHSSAKTEHGLLASLLQSRLDTTYRAPLCEKIARSAASVFLNQGAAHCCKVCGRSATQRHCLRQHILGNRPMLLHWHESDHREPSEPVETNLLEVH